MTQKSGFIGNDSPENRFLGPGGEEYFLQINPATKETEVWNEDFASDRRVGNYTNGKFVPNESLWRGLNKNEKNYFNSAEGFKQVNNSAAEVLQNSGGRINGSDKVLNSKEQFELLNPNQAQAGETDQSTNVDPVRQPETKEQRDQRMASMGGEGIGRKKYSNYCYPITLRRGQQDRLKISVIEFKPKTLNKGGTGFDGRSASRKAFLGRQSIGSVILPITNVGDSNKTKWGEDNMNMAQIMAANIALNTLDAGLLAGGDAITGVAQEIQGNKEVKDAVKQFFVQKATGVKGILSRTSGSVINPNLELIFEGPQLGSFGFTYRLSARDPKESAEIRKIIRMFKQSSRPQTTPKGTFLKAPNTYRLEYLTAGQDKSHPYLPKIKECALTSFDVNYVPDNQYMTYEDSSMVAYEITFAFSELDPIYNNDYTSLDGDGDSSVGY